MFNLVANIYVRVRVYFYFLSHIFIFTFYRGMRGISMHNFYLFVQQLEYYRRIVRKIYYPWWVYVSDEMYHFTLLSSWFLFSAPWISMEVKTIEIKQNIINYEEYTSTISLYTVLDSMCIDDPFNQQCKVEENKVIQKSQR